MGRAPEYTPAGIPVWGRNDKGEPICNARRADGTHCQRCRFLTYRGRCLKHHGRDQKVPVNKRIRTEERFNMYYGNLPANLQDRFLDLMENQRDPNLIQELQLLDLRLTEVVSTIDNGLDEATITYVEKTINELENSIADEEADSTTLVTAIAGACARMRKAITGGRAQERGWRQFESLAHSRGKLLQIDQTLREKANAMIELEEALSLLRFFTEVLFISAHPQNTRRVSDEVKKLRDAYELTDEELIVLYGAIGNDIMNAIYTQVNGLQMLSLPEDRENVIDVSAEEITEEEEEEIQSQTSGPIRIRR